MKNFCILSFLSLTVLTFTGCSRSVPRIRPVSENSVILAFGDSLTYGTGASNDESYPSILSGILGCNVINAGRPGELSQQGLMRLPRLLEEHRPDILLLCHGGNDMLQKINSDITIDNINNMISIARQNDVDVILIGVPKPGLLVRTAGFYKEIAKEQNILFDGKSLSKILSDSQFKSDTIHPNAKGYKVLAEAIAKIIRSSQN